MNQYSTIYLKILCFLHKHGFWPCLFQLKGNRRIRLFACIGQILFMAFVKYLILQASMQYRRCDFVVELKKMVYALNLATTNFRMFLFRWVQLRRVKGASNLHPHLDLRAYFPVLFATTYGGVHDAQTIDTLVTMPNADYTME